MTSVTVMVPMTIRRRGGRKQIIGPAGTARAFRWPRMLEEGRYASIRELAAAEVSIGLMSAAPCALPYSHRTSSRRSSTGSSLRG